jgi:thiosulfate/3-mercaptopyruvate sulfurtransferase
MINASQPGGRKASFYFRILLLVAAPVLLLPPHLPAQANKASTPDPWDKTQVMTPVDLVKLLASSGAKKPPVVCVGFEFLYKGAHIPGARFIGPGRETKGIEALKQWARSVSPDTDVVIYCGCCPFKQCPNIRPAYEALHQVGLTRIRVLEIEESFEKDWVAKGYPVEKGAEH